MENKELIDALLELNQRIIISLKVAAQAEQKLEEIIKNLNEKLSKKS